MFEASMNFDLENVEPFLTQLESRLNLGLPVPELVAFTQSTAIDDERVSTLSVRFGGEVISLDYRVFMDDVDAPDLYFFTASEELCKAIGAELSDFAEKHGL